MPNQCPKIISELLTKKADDPSIRTDIAQRLMKMLAGTAAMGAAFRGATGVVDSMTGKDLEPSISQKPLILDLPYPTKKKPMSKFGFDLMDHLFPTNIQRANDAPGFYPAMGGAMIGGTAGGYKLMDWLIKKKKQRDTSQQLDDVRKEYQSALASQFEPTKSALDKLAHSYTKNADILPKLEGGYLTLAGLLAGASGIGTYKYLKSNDPDKVLEKIMKEREQKRWASRPPEIYVRPKPFASPNNNGVVSPAEGM